MDWLESTRRGGVGDKICGAHWRFLPQFRIEVGNHDRGDRHQHDHRAGGAHRHLIARERVGIHERRRQFGGTARILAGDGQHEIVGFDRHVGEHDDGGEKHRPHDRDHDPPIGRIGGGAVDLRGLQDLAVNAPKAREKHRHDKAGRLPDARNRDAIDHHAGIDDPIELESWSSPNRGRLFRAQCPDRETASTPCR